MKKFRFAFLLFALPFFCTAFAPASKNWGGDVFEIYLNGKQVHQQFVHADKSTKALRLSSFTANDKIDVLYSHCGQMGSGRVLVLRNEKNDLVKELKFADAESGRSLMRFSRSDIGKQTAQKLNLYYRSKEIPEGKLLAVVTWNEGQHLAKR